MEGQPGSNIKITDETAQLNIDRLGINYHELPPRPVWASFFGPADPIYKSRIAAKVMAGSIITNRELTPVETNALAQHYAGVLNAQAYVAPMSSLTSSVIWWRSYDNYSFPFWTPKRDKFNPHSLFGMKSAAFPHLWHSLRFLAWYSGCRLIIGIFVTSSALSTYVQKYNTDARLVDYRKDTKEGIAKMSSGRTPQGQLGRQQPRPALPAKEESFESWPGTEQNTQDAQPPFPAAQKPVPESAADPFAADEPYVFDDASPVAPAEQQKGASRRPVQGGSAWDRIRKGSQTDASNAAAGRGSSQQTSAWGRKREDELTSQGARDGTSYTYSSGDEQKSYAKEQSQKEFDEMLERERRGEASGRR